MNEYVLTAAVILAILGAGLGLLLRFGVTEAAYFGVFIVAATIMGSVGYTWWKTQTDKTVERLRRELLLKIKKDIANTKKNVTEASELVEQDQVLADIEEIKRNLINLGLYDKNFRVTRNAKNFTLTLIEQENRKTEQRLRGLENMAAVNYRPKLEEYIEGLESWLDELENTGFRIQGQREEFRKIATQDSVSLKELLDKRERIARAFSGILKECGTEVQELLKLAEKYGSVKRMSKTVAKAKKSFEDFETGVEDLVEARNQLKNFLQDFYEIEHRQMTSSINNLSPALKNDYIPRERRETLERIMEEATAITDPGLIGELHRLKKEYKEEVLSLVREMHSSLKDLEEKISAFSPPTDIWMEDEKGEALVGRLRIDSELRVFSRHSAEAIEHLTSRLRESDVLLRILQNYDKIESLITAKLRHSGRLAATDLNVKYSDKFLLIYSKKHSDTIYRQTTSTLVKI
jgi:hypothetical protein